MRPVRNSSAAVRMMLGATRLSRARARGFWRKRRGSMSCVAEKQQRYRIIVRFVVAKKQQSYRVTIFTQLLTS